MPVTMKSNHQDIKLSTKSPSLTHWLSLKMSASKPRDITVNISWLSRAWTWSTIWVQSFCLVREHVQDVADWRVETENKKLPLSHLAPSLPMIPLEFRAEVNRQETRIMGLSSSEDRMIIAGVILAWYRTVTDRRSDNRSDRIYHS